MDLLQLPETKDGNRYLLVLVDILTRYAVAIPIKDKSAKRVTDTLRKRVFVNGLLGPPVNLISDNGLEFSNQAMTRLLRRNGVKHRFTTPYNPKANGSTERLNRTLLSLLRGLLTPGVEWDKAVEPVLQIYNNCPHSATKLSPYEAITGRPSRPPHVLPDCQALLSNTEEVALTEQTAPNTNLRLRARFRDRRQFAEAWAEAERSWERQLESHFGDLREEHNLSRFHRNKAANKNRLDHVLREDDLVVIRDVHKPPGVEGKLRRPYVGPWVVKEVTANKTLKLASLEGGVLPRLIPIDHVRLWKRSDPPV